MTGRGRTSADPAVLAGGPAPAATSVSGDAHGARSELAVAVALGLTCALVLLARVPPGLTDTLWAEDGSRFLSQALSDPAVPTLFEPYAGYLHLVPRALALVTSHVPVLLMARVTTCLACLSVGAVSAVVYVCSRELVPTRVVRGWLALGPALLPVVAQEAVGTTANLHWFLLWGCFWVLWRRTSGTWALAALTAFVLLATLSEIQCALLLPVALVATWRHSRRGQPARTLLPTAAWALGAVAQGVATVLDPRPGMSLSVHGGLGLRTFVDHVLSPLCTNDPSLLHEWVVRRWSSPPIVVSLLVAVSVAYCLGRGSWRLRAGCAAAVGFAYAFFAVALVLNSRAMPLGVHSPPALAVSRYAIVPELLVLAAVGFAWQVALDRRDGGMVTLVVAMVVTGCVVGLLSFHAPTNRRSATTLWSTQVAVATRACRSTPRWSVRIPVSPTGGSWGVQMPCRRLVTPHRAPP